MIPTLDYIERHFQQYNQQIFGGKLAPLPMRIGTARTTLGGVHFVREKDASGKDVFTDFKMVISARFDLPEEEVQDTLIHEMIHYYILSNQWHDDAPHGTIFVKLMKTINSRFGRHITISHRMSKETSSKDRTLKKHYLGVSVMADGKWGITLAAETRLFDIWRDMPKCFRLRSITWYGTTDPYFNRFPRALKPKIYLVDEQELKEHLRDAIELVNDGDTIRPK